MIFRGMMLLGLGFAILALGAGCGGGDSSGGGGTNSGTDGGGSDSTAATKGSTEASQAVKTASLSKAEFLKRANAICVEERNEIPKKTIAYQSAQRSVQPSEEYSAGVKAVLLPTFEAEIGKLRKLGAPAGEEEQVETMINGQQQAVEEVAALGNFTSFEEIAPYFSAVAQEMVEYGLGNCAIIPEPSQNPNNNGG